jgi:hypothetical protein
MMTSLTLPARRSMRAAVAAALLATLTTVGAGLLLQGHRGSASVDARALLRQMPLSFEANAGQAGADVRFIARAPGYALALTADGSRLTLGAPGHAPATLTTRFVGAQRATVGGTRPRHGRVNYLTGDQPGRWTTDVPTFGGVSYTSVWPGVDVAFHGTREQLEYDYILAPGADPAAIAQRITGATSLRLDRAGDLIIGLGGSTIRQHAPFSYQERDGRREVVESRFVVRGDTVGIAVGAYDRTRPLTIDPILSYGTYLGGSGPDGAFAVKTDSDGALYIAGSTQSSGFASDGAYQEALGDSNPNAIQGDAYVAKLSDDGAELKWATYIGGADADSANAITLTSDGDVVVAGATKSGDFPTKNTSRTAYQGLQDAFALRLGADGDVLRWSQYLGGNKADAASDVALGAADSVVVGGFTASSDMPTGGGGISQSYEGGSQDGFLLDLRADGSLAHGGYLGGSGGDSVSAVAVDDGRVYATGTTYSTNFPTTGGAQQGVKAGGEYYDDGFVVRFDAWSLSQGTYFGGAGSESVSDLAVDDAGNAYIAGGTYSDDLPGTAGAYQDARADLNQSDAFVAKIPTLTTVGGWATYLGGYNFDAASAIAIDADGAAYVTGSTMAPNFPTTADAVQPAKPGPVSGGGYYTPFEGFYSVISPDGAELEGSTYLGGQEYDAGNAITVGADGRVVVVGSTVSDDMPVTDDAYQGGRGGNTDAFLFATDAGAATGGGGEPNGPGDGVVVPPGTPPADGSGPPGAPPTTVAPAPVTGVDAAAGDEDDEPIDDIDLSDPRFRAAPSGPSATAAAVKKVGTVVAYKLDRSATVRFTVERPSKGRAGKKGKCDKPTSKNKKKKACTRWTAVKGSFTRTGVVGVNRFKFTGRMAGKKLAPGRYRLAATPTAAGRKGTTATVAFTIIK